MFPALLLAVTLVSKGDTLGAMMPTGDSITDGQGSTDGLGYRDNLATLLTEYGIVFSYVGDELGGGQNEAYPGHFRGGVRIEELYPPGFGNGWGTGTFDIGPALRDLHPDVLLVHLGTNNIASLDGVPEGPYSLDDGSTLNHSYAGYLAELITFIVSQYPGYPSATPLIVLCRIVPIRDLTDRVLLFNGYLDEMARDMARGMVTGAPVHVVVCDQFTPFMENPLLFTGLPGDYMSDWGHPNDLGYAVMAASYCATLQDDAPPGAVEDLAVWGQASHSVSLRWTSPGDDWWSGTASQVILRFAAAPIDGDESFAAAWDLATPLSPSPGGVVQMLTAGGLPAGRVFWVALTVTDDAGNVSGVSNSPSVEVAAADSLVELFDVSPDPSVWNLGEDYYVEGGQIRTAYPFPVWRAPAVMVAEQEPWECALQIPATAPGGETGRVGLVIMGDVPEQGLNGLVLLCVGSMLELRTMNEGILGATVETAVSRHGALQPGSWLGAIPFVSEGQLQIRALRNGLPDCILSTGSSAQVAPSPRYAGIIMQGALGWGVDGFKLGGPGLWEPPDPFHLIGPDSAAVVGMPPLLVWERATDPDPWDSVSYVVEWSSSLDYPTGATFLIDCATDTSCQFPSEGFQQGVPVYWRVVATDETGLARESWETGWWFRPDTLGSPRPQPIVMVSAPWPNPCRGTIRLQFPTDAPDDVVLRLYDLRGRVVATGRIPTAPSMVWRIPLSVSSGAYTLVVGRGTTVARYPVVLAR